MFRSIYWRQVGMMDSDTKIQIETDLHGSWWKFVPWKPLKVAKAEIRWGINTEQRWTTKFKPIQTEDSFFSPKLRCKDHGPGISFHKPPGNASKSSFGELTGTIHQMDSDHPFGSKFRQSHQIWYWRYQSGSHPGPLPSSGNLRPEWSCLSAWTTCGLSN